MRFIKGSSQSETEAKRFPTFYVENIFYGKHTAVRRQLFLIFFFFSDFAFCFLFFFAGYVFIFKMCGQENYAFYAFFFGGFDFRLRNEWQSKSFQCGLDYFLACTIINNDYSTNSPSMFVGEGATLLAAGQRESSEDY